MSEILWMNVNLIELLKMLQLSTIQNSFDGNNIKQQAIKRLKDKTKWFYMLNSWKFSS